MNNLISFTDLFESIPDFKKIALLMFLVKNDVNFFIRMVIFKKCYSLSI